MRLLLIKTRKQINYLINLDAIAFVAMDATNGDAEVMFLGDSATIDLGGDDAESLCRFLAKDAMVLTGEGQG